MFNLALQKSSKSFYLTEQTANNDIRTTETHALTASCAYTIDFSIARIVEKKMSK